MKRKTFQVKAFIQILDEFIKAKEIDPPDATGLRAWGKRKEKLPNGQVLEVSFLSNWYSKLKHKQPSEHVGIYEESLLGVLLVLDYESIDDFLKKRGYASNEGILVPIRDINSLRALNPPHPNEWIDRYVLNARFVPAIVAISGTGIAVSIASFKIEFIPSITSLIFIGLFIIFASSFSNWISTQGKSFEKKLFSNEKLGLPTSYLMLYSISSKYSPNQKEEYREKVKAYFGIILKSENEETKDLNQALQLLTEAGTKVKDNVKSTIIRSSNIRYGQLRNLIPATLIGAIISAFCILSGILLADTLIIIASALLTTTLLLWHIRLRNGKALIIAAETYAIYLIDEFLSR